MSQPHPATEQTFVRPQTHSSPPTTTITTTSTSTTDQLSPLARNVRQLSLFATGCALLSASVLVSRRAVLRRIATSRPSFYTGNRTPVRFDGQDRSLLAVQAFGLATLNVMTFGVMLVGGVSWGFDLCSPAELRERSREALRKPGLVNAEDEEEMKEMMDGLLTRLGMTLPGEEGENQKGDATKQGEGDAKTA